MPEPLLKVDPTSRPARPLGHWVLLAGAVATLLLLGHYGAQLRALVGGWLGAGSGPAPTGSLLAPSLPAGLLYIGLYLGLSVLVLHLALANWRQTRLVVGLYAGALAVVAGLLVVGRLAGVGSGFTSLAHDLMGGGPIDSGGLLSPLPLLLLLAVFRLAPRG